MLENMTDVYQPIIGEPADCGDGQTGDGSEEVQSEYRSDPSLSMEYDEEFENLVNTMMHDKDYISVNQAALNITYTIINVGLIAIPFTAFNAGMPLFIAVIIIMSIISYYVAVMVINMANQKRVRTLEDLAEVCGGPKFFLCVCAFQILFSFSMMCVTLDVWADVMSDVFASSSLTGIAHHLLATRRGEVLVGAAVVLPLCVFKRSMISLRWTAYLTVCAVAFCLSAVVVAYFAHKEGPSLDTSATDLVTPQSEWWTVMFVVVFCFSYNQRVFAVYRCLKRRNTERWAQAVRKASISVTVLYLLFGIAGYLTMARRGLKLDNFNYFLDDHGENIVLFNVARVVVVSSLLLTIPVDSLVASSTWRRLYNRYLKLVAPKYHHPSDTSGSSRSARRRLEAEQEGLLGHTADPPQKQQQQQPGQGCEEDQETSRQYQSEDTAAATAPMASVDGRLSHSSSTNTTSEYGQHMVLNTHDAGAVLSHPKGVSAPLLPSQSLGQSSGNLACSPPHVTLSHLNMLMNATPPVPVLGLRQSNSTGSLASAGSPAAAIGDAENPATDRHSFTSNATSTSTGTGGASSTTGSGVAGHRMISREEMNSILRANSFDTKSRKSLTAKSQHEQDAEFDAQHEGGELDNSWLSNASLSYDIGHDARGMSGVSGVGGHTGKRRVVSVWQRRQIPLLLWVLCTATCIGVNRWMYIAATVGTISTTMLLFIFPTMFYFRMTLASDYGATPLCGRLVPNALYMGVIQALGIVILLWAIAAMIYLPISGAHIIRDET